MLELAIRHLDLNSITEVPRYDDPDPYTILQVYDFTGCKILRDANLWSIRDK